MKAQRSAIFKLVLFSVVALTAAGLQPLATSAEQRPSLQGLQNQINALQSQIDGALNPCPCWTQESLLNLAATGIPWAAFKYDPDRGEIGVAPFICNSNVSAGPLTDENRLSAELKAQSGTSPASLLAFVRFERLAGPGVTEQSGCQITGGDFQSFFQNPQFPSVHDAEKAAQSCYIQLVDLMQSLPCDLNP